MPWKYRVIRGAKEGDVGEVAVFPVEAGVGIQVRVTAELQRLFRFPFTQLSPRKCHGGLTAYLVGVVNGYHPKLKHGKNGTMYLQLKVVMCI